MLFFFFVLLASDCKRELENASWERKKKKKSSGKRSNFELAVNHCPVVFFLPDSERLAHRGTRSFAGFLAWDHPYHRISKLNPTTQVDEVFLFLRGNWPTLKKRKKEKKREKKKVEPSSTVCLPTLIDCISFISWTEMSFLDQSRGVRVRVRAYTFFSPLVIFLNFVTRENSNEESERESCAWTSEKERERERKSERARREKVIRIVVRIVIEKYRTATTTTSWIKEKRKGYGRRDERDENERL